MHWAMLTHRSLLTGRRLGRRWKRRCAWIHFASNRYFPTVSIQDQTHCTSRHTSVSQGLILLWPVLAICLLDLVVSNAIKFTPAGGKISVLLELSQFEYNDCPALAEVLSNLDADAERDVGSVLMTLRVRDSGCGLSPESCQSLFAAFVQVQANKGQGGQGTGLGLSIAKSIVELHGGTIGVTSAVGTGSDFFMHMRVPVVLCSCYRSGSHHVSSLVGEHSQPGPATPKQSHASAASTVPLTTLTASIPADVRISIPANDAPTGLVSSIPVAGAEATVAAAAAAGGTVVPSPLRSSTGMVTPTTLHSRLPSYSSQLSIPESRSLSISLAVRGQRLQQQQRTALQPMEEPFDFNDLSWRRDGPPLHHDIAALLATPAAISGWDTPGTFQPPQLPQWGAAAAGGGSNGVVELGSNVTSALPSGGSDVVPSTPSGLAPASTSPLVGLRVLLAEDSLPVRSKRYLHSCTPCRVHVTHCSCALVLWLMQNRKLLLALLNGLKCTATGVENGQLCIDALQQAEREGVPFHCVLIDGNMPVCSTHNS
jgi:CheY-like chemotaxis protein